MGASSGRLILQVAGETAPLGIAGAGLGLWLTRLFHDVILGMLPGNISRASPARTPSRWTHA